MNKAPTPAPSSATESRIVPALGHASTVKPVKAAALPVAAPQNSAGAPDLQTRALREWLAVARAQGCDVHSSCARTVLCSDFIAARLGALLDQFQPYVTFA